MRILAPPIITSLPTRPKIKVACASEYLKSLENGCSETSAKDLNSEPTPVQPRGVEHANVIDIVAHDATTGEAALIMLETRPWDDSEARLFQLQEKLNAYLSFALDGEMAEAYPALVNLPLRVQIDCATPPEGATLDLLSHVHDQIAFQGIKLEVRVMGAGGCGPACDCAALTE